jgi:predicted ATPase
MRLKRLEIHNYKSLRNVVIEPTPLAVFVGPNGAGKTNLADAIDFLGQAYRWDLESAVAQKGGYENICYRDTHRSAEPIRFRIVSDIGISAKRLSDFSDQPVSEEDGPFILSHFFQFRAQSQGIQAPFAVELEAVVVSTLREPIFTLELAPDDSDNPALAVRLLESLTSELRRLEVFQLNPQSCRQSGVPTPNSALDRLGGNLPAAIAYLKKNYLEEYSQIVETLRRINPAIEAIETGFTHTKTLALFLREKGVKRPWTSEDISDGTIQTIALLAAIFDPRSPLVVIEEPENSIHPWALRNLVEAFRLASEKKQILLTTHSPILIDQLKPEEVWVVRKPGTETKIDPLLRLDPSLAEAWGEGKFTLSEYLDSGAVPEAVPAASA